MNEDFFSKEELCTLRQIALEELHELADKLEAVARILQERPGDPAARKTVLHIFHTIGGSAALASFHEISQLGVDMESRLKAAEAEPALSPELMEKIAGSYIRLMEMLAQA